MGYARPGVDFRCIVVFEYLSNGPRLSGNELLQRLHRFARKR